MLLIRKTLIPTTTEAVRLPKGKLVTGYLRVSTTGNTGDIHFADSPKTALADYNRYTIGEDKLTPLRLPVGFELSSLWVAADVANDCVSLMAEVEDPVPPKPSSKKKSIP